MEIGIDSFAKKTQTNEGGNVVDDAHAMSELIERIEHADKVGLDVFGRSKTSSTPRSVLAISPRPPNACANIPPLSWPLIASPCWVAR